MTASKEFFKNLASKSGWDIARELGCDYSGDMDPIVHGGYFYDARDWERYGHASCVEFWVDPDAEDDTLVVQRGTINKPSNGSDMEACFRCIGLEPGNPERDNIHAQIEAVRAYCGIEVDGTDYPDLMTYQLKDWSEWRIWKSVYGWLKQLGE